MVRPFARSFLALCAALAGTPAQEPVESLELNEFSLELRAAWEPLTDTTYGFEERYPLVRDLAPAAARARYGAERFRPLLPPAEAMAVGSTWRIDAEAVLPFLRQLHPGATAELHHGVGNGVAAHGAWGCLRALGATQAEIVFRAHAEFLLAGDGSHGTSSWLTPAQFRGRMVVDRRRGEVVGFELALPTATANVDLNIATEHGISADIGRIPRMELRGGELPALESGAERIPEEEALDLLLRRFYPFAEIGWRDLAAARAESLATGKPLHVVALFGSLADESC